MTESKVEVTGRPAGRPAGRPVVITGPGIREVKKIVDNMLVGCIVIFVKVVVNEFEFVVVITGPGIDACEDGKRELDVKVLVV